MINKYFCMAVALAAAGMTGCSEDEPNVNPTEGETVKTSFAISLPYQFGTRMSGDNVQANGNFLGMQNIRMFPLTTAGADNVALSRMIALGNIAADGLTNQTKVYNDVQVDVNTNNFLFYALAGSTDPSTTAFANGYMTDNLSSGVVNTNDIEFKLNRIRPNANFDTDGAAVLQALNDVADASGWSASQDEQLKALYDLYIKNTAGSAASVKVLLEDLNNKMTALNTGSTATVAQAVIDAIRTAKDAIDASTFPRDYNLPDGVAQVAWNSTAFEFVGNAGVMIGANAIDPTTICYPAGLYYMANTPIKTTDALDPVFPSFTNWANGFATDWTGTSVTATTRGIALTNPVQYAVASLAVKVKCATSTLPDNAEEYAEDPTTGGQTQTITVPADGFKLTGVVIGGQPETVGWDFKNLESDEHLMNIYDNAVPADVTAKYGSESPINYTLVLEDLVQAAVSDKTQASVVNIALEFENTSGQSFYGQDGLVPAGAKFYLVGQLNLNAQQGVTDTTGRTSVFSQDYTTTATFTISSLENAYNGIPDLRASKMKFGLAVDLTWQAGVSFDVTIE